MANPSLMNERGYIDHQIRSFLASNNSNSRLAPNQDIIIPVVFHLLENTGEPGSIFTYQQILCQLEEVNRAFSGQISKAGQPSQVRDSHIKFCLASNPIGPSQWTNPNEPGVMRYNDPNNPTFGFAYLFPLSSSTTNFSTLINITHPTPSYFPPDRVLNIWVNKIQIATAQASFPKLQKANLQAGQLDGIIINWNAIGSDPNLSSCSYPFANPLFSNGYTLAHEIGHYLDLFHPFENTPYLGICNNSNCVGGMPIGSGCDACDVNGDRMCDVPPCQPTPFGTCNTLNTCTNNNDYPINNFMSYSDESCKTLFSDDQIDWMRACLENPAINRFSLWQAPNLNQTGLICQPNNCLLTSFSLDKTIICPNENITFTPIQLNNCNVTYSWSFQGANISASTNATPTVFFNNPGSYQVTLTVSDGINSSTNSVTIDVEVPVVFVNYPTIPVCAGEKFAVKFSTQNKFPPYLVTLSNGLTHTLYSNEGYIMVDAIEGENNISVSNFASVLGGCPFLINNPTFSFQAFDCFCNKVTNGSFDLGNISFTSNFTYNNFPATPVSGANASSTCYRYDIENPLTAIAEPAIYLQSFGNAINFLSPNDLYPNCRIRQNPEVLWSQVVELSQNSSYQLNFLVSSNVDEFLVNQNLLFSAVLRDNQQNTIWSGPLLNTLNNSVGQTIYNGVQFMSNQENYFWQQYLETIPTNGIGSGNYTLEILMHDNFGTTYEFYLDEISLREVIGNNFSSTVNTCGPTPIGYPSSNNSIFYSWTPTIGLSDPTVPNPILNYSGVNTYTLNMVDNSGNLCFATKTVQVQNDVSLACCRIIIPNLQTTDFDLSTIASLPPNSQIMVDENITATVSSNLTLTDLHFTMAKGSSIIIEPSATLTLNNVTFEGCDHMWDGIRLEPSSTLICQNSLIKDAMTAIDARDNTSLDIENTTFEKNDVSISLSGKEQCGTQSTIQFSVANSIFRKGVGDMLPPRSGYYPVSGIFVNKVNYIEIQANNTFDELYNAISAIDANVEVLGGNFSRIMPSPCSPFSFFGLAQGCSYANYQSLGSAIYANSQEERTKCIRWLTVHDAEFNNSPQATAIFSSRTLTRVMDNTISNFSIGVKTAQSKGRVDVSYNNMEAVNSGVILSLSHAIKQNVIDNIIVLNNNGLSLKKNGVMPANIGVALYEPVGSFAYNVIENNQIRGGRTGILLDNAKEYTYVGFNQVTWDNISHSFVGNCNGIEAIRGNGYKLVNNEIIGNSPIYAEPSSTLQFAFANPYRKNGITVNGSTDYSMVCNLAKNIGYGAQILGESKTRLDYIQTNSFINNRHGFILRRNNTIDGDVGQFVGDDYISSMNTFGGLFYDPATNQFTQGGFYSQGYKTWNYTNNPFADRTKFYYPVSINPPNFGGSSPALGVGPLKSDNQSNATIIQNNCAIFLHPDGNGGNQGGLAISEDELNEMLKIANDELVFDEFETISKFIKERNLYTRLQLEPSLSLADTALASFKSEKTYQDIGKLYEYELAYKALGDSTVWTDSAALASKLSSLYQKNNSISGSELHTLNEKKINELLYRLEESDEIDQIYDEIEIEFIQKLAEECPFIGGEGVYLARALYNTLSTDNIQVDDTWLCQSLGVFKTELKEDEFAMPTFIEVEQTISVYPNPSSGKFLFDFRGSSSVVNRLVIVDVLGRVVGSERISNLPVQSLDLTSKPSGIYFYKLYDASGSSLQEGKLIRHD